ncbi:MAG TPA: dynamin family protein, partial [Phormidium sp.]
IKENIQAISDELSEYIGNALQVELSTNPIQFPNFEFSGIDAKVKKHQEVVIRTEKRKKSRCCNSDEVYKVEIPESITIYEIDLRLILEQFKLKIDEQVLRNLELIQRVIQKQVTEDFRKGEQQINDYIDRFQSEFDQLLKQRATREIEAPEIVAKLEAEKEKNSAYLSELAAIQVLLDSGKPASQSEY